MKDKIVEDWNFEIQCKLDKSQVTGAGDWKPFRHSLYKAQNDRLYYVNRCHG